ncbi:hypothetical protein ACQ7B2_16125, partial [Escherichia coli]
CTACLPLLRAGGGEIGEMLRDHCAASALALSGAWAGIADEFHFRPYAEELPQDHDSARRFGWISPE